MSELLLDRAGRRRSPATMPGFHAGRPPHNMGLRYPADPPKVEEIIAVMRTAGDCPHGRRLGALVVLLWRAGLRIHEALALTEGDLSGPGSSRRLLVHGAGGATGQLIAALGGGATVPAAATPSAIGGRGPTSHDPSLTMSSQGPTPAARTAMSVSPAPAGRGSGSDSSRTSPPNRSIPAAFTTPPACRPGYPARHAAFHA
jgi:hypothetical protein